VSSHFKFEVRIKTAGETDDEDRHIELFAKAVRELARTWTATHEAAGIRIEIELGDVERN